MHCRRHIWLISLALVLVSCTNSRRSNSSAYDVQTPRVTEEAPSQASPKYEPWVSPVRECRLICPHEIEIVVRSNGTWWMVNYTIADHHEDRLMVGTYRVLDKSVFVLTRNGVRRPVGYLKETAAEPVTQVWEFSTNPEFRNALRMDVPDRGEVGILRHAQDPFVPERQ